MTHLSEKIKVSIPQDKENKFKKIHCILNSICPKMLNCDVKTILIKFIQDESYNEICYDRLIFSKEKKIKKINLNKECKSFSPDIMGSIDTLCTNYSKEDQELIFYTLSLDIQTLAQEFADNNKITNSDYIKITENNVEFFIKNKIFTLI